MDLVGETSARERLDTLLTRCVEQGASDLHLSPGLPPMLRVEGDLQPQPFPVLTGADLIGFAEALLRIPHRGDADLESMREKGSADGALSGHDGTRYRFNIFRRQGEHAIVIRRLDDRFRPLHELGLPEALYKLCDLRDGLVIVSGATGSGKSTTLATLIDRINRTAGGHIVTIEDPIEYVHKSISGIVNQRQIGLDAPTFNDALVASLRQDPDVILVGEIRDLATIRTAITAAETGHLVFTTLHAGDCVSSLERLVSVFPANEQDGVRRQLSLVLRAVVAQHLLPAAAQVMPSQIPGAVQVSRRSRRVAASEILMVTPAVANLTATAKSAQIYSSMESGQALGMQTLEQDLARLWVAGKITETTAVATARNPNIMRDRAAMLRARSGTGFVGAR